MKTKKIEDMTVQDILAGVIEYRSQKKDRLRRVGEIHEQIKTLQKELDELREWGGMEPPIMSELNHYIYERLHS